MRLVFLLLPLIIGLIIGFLSHDKVIQITAPKATPTQFDSSNDLRVNLNSVYRENIILLTSSLRRIYNKEPYSPDALEALSENTDDIGDIIKTYYGPGAKSDFLDLWKNQNSAYISYTEAVRDRDLNKKSQAEHDLKTHIDASLLFWKKLNPTFNTNDYQVMLADRISFIKNFVNDLSNGNITQSFKEQHNAYQQNGKIADFLTLSVVKQFPEKFK